MASSMVIEEKRFDVTNIGLLFIISGEVDFGEMKTRLIQNLLRPFL